MENKNHLKNCLCGMCKSIRGETKGSNNPNFNNHKLLGIKRPEHSKTMLGSNNPNWKGGLPKCIDCGKKVSTKDTKRCKKCSVQGKLNPNYINGENQILYPSEFNNELKESIRKRDNYTCQNPECNMTEEEHIIVYGFNLNVHHIDYNKKNCKQNNLISLCHQCNIRANFNRNFWKKLFIGLLRKVDII